MLAWTSKQEAMDDAIGKHNMLLCARDDLSVPKVPSKVFVEPCRRPRSMPIRLPSLLRMPASRPQIDDSRSSRVASKSYRFNFDIAPMGVDSQCLYGESVIEPLDAELDANKTCWRLLDFSAPESRKSLRGGITIARGSPLQTFEIETLITISSYDAQDLDNVIVGKVDSGLNMGYQFRDNHDHCTEVSITIFLKPSKLDIFLFNIWTNIFDISFESQLGWTINHLHTHTAHGSTTMDNRPYIEALYAHHIEMVSLSGAIKGYFRPYSSLHLSTTSGPITLSVDLSQIFHSSRTPDIPTTLPIPSLSITTHSGPIYIQSTHDLLPSYPFTHTTTLSTQTGNIYAVLPHGFSTGASTVTGNVTLYLRTYKAAEPGLRNDLWTSSVSGDVRVFVSEPRDTAAGTGNRVQQVTRPGITAAKGEENEQYNPLLSMVSSHNNLGEGGSMMLRYPRAWYGKLEAEVRDGRVDVKGSLLWGVERGEGFVRATRGFDGRSQMGVVVNRGVVDLSVGL
ncbi:hypothetical protein K491DRAFT_778120 [Lophiostoma macrostomum CBS 122681]|uniref:Uncharacterized protein n=1 Tax=Lophiostoma macrostomum CBS 122681 TaxID=1314788 RepID=A0A6A6TCH6_9PLEO|nr:hypothetical protein K491DRAFT_778120 [Lophiostoma macrostomum CBS 122681]